MAGRSFITIFKQKSEMKNIFLLLISLLCLTGAKAQNQQQFFQLPLIPDSLQNLQDRTDFMVTHYWDFCDLNKAFSSRDKMADAFDTYLSFMPYASATVVYREVPRFMDRISKKADNVLFIAEQAEAKLYSDTATYPSDELFILFTSEVLKNKKVDKTAKLRYNHLFKVLTNSQPGSLAPMFEYTDLLGQKNKLEIDTARIGTILFFNYPDCSDCSMARLRLDTDILTRKILESGKMQLVSIYPGEPENEWIEQALDYPKTWKTIASEEVNDLYDLRYTPMFYVINPNGAILLRTDDVNTIISIMATLSERIGQ